MNGRGRGNCRGGGTGFAHWRSGLLSLLAGLALAGAATAQGAVPSRAHSNKTYLNKNVVVLPINFDPRFRDELKEVQLYMKDNPSRPWTLQDRAQPSRTEFLFRTINDGEYWFTLVTVDKQGRLNPPDLTQTPPALVVVVDRKMPEVEIKPTSSSAAEGPTFQVTVSDANHDALRTQFEYQSGDRQWRSAEVGVNRPDTFVVPPQAVFTGLVRVSATDRAGNMSQKELHVADLAPASGNQHVKVPVTAPPGVLPVKYRPDLDSSEGSVLQPVAPRPVGSVVPPAPIPQGAVSAATLPPRPPTALDTEGPPRKGIAPRETTLGQATVPPLPPTVPVTTTQVHSSPVAAPVTMPPCNSCPVAAAVPPQPRATTPLVPGKARQVVRNTRVVLEYQIEQTGPSGIGKVEVWITGDKGQKWHRLGEDSDRASPVEVDLPGEGEYGLALSVTNGRGFGGEPPAPGTTPEWVIDVDTIRPVAEFQTIRPLTGPEAGHLMITWVARDRNLGPEPIDLYYAPERDGPWKLVAKGIRNDGQYRWTAPSEAGGKVFLRLVTTDLAGNSFQCDTDQPVLVDDMSRPRVRVLGINAQVPRPGLGQ